MMLKRYLILIIGLIINLTFSVSESQSRQLPHYDLASSYLMADVVVWVNELSEEKSDATDYSDSLEKVKILKVFKGDAQPGETWNILVDNLFARHKPFDGVWECVEQTEDGCKKQQMARWNDAPMGQALMFLIKSKDPKSNYQLLDMKLITNNTIYAFKQLSNPGPKELVLSSAEWITGTTYGPQELEQDLMLAMERVKEFEKVYAAKDIEGLKKYLPLLIFQVYPGNHIEANALSRKAAELIGSIADEQTLTNLLNSCQGKCEYYVVSVLKSAVSNKLNNVQ